MSKPARARVRRWQATAILTLFFIAVAGAAAIGWWYARESPPHQGPIVLISVDGIRTGALHAYGAPPADTPGIDAFSEQAVVFERAYAHSPHIVPAHASILSGQLPLEHGVRDDAGFTMDGKIRTLAELLRNRGFATGAALSSFLLRDETGIGQGFSFYDDEMASPDPGDVIPGSLPLDRSGDLTLDAAERFIRAQGSQRYFLLVQVPAADADAAVTRIAGILHSRKLYDGATIVLIGDHGPTDAAGPMSEDALRVPLLIKQPGNEGAGHRVHVPVQQIDLAPTILDLVRAPIPGELHGRSLKPVLDDGNGRLEAQPIYSESLAAHFRFGGHPLFALTVNGLRYVRAADEQLVTLDPGDPGNTADTGIAPATLVADAGDQVAPLRATLDRMISRRPIAAPVTPPESEQERLARAGYLAGVRPAVDGGADDIGGVEQQRAVAAAHEEAARLAGARRFGAAVRALQAIVRSYPRLAAVHYQIGVLSMDLGRTADAIAAFRRAAELRPDAPEIARALALALARAGGADEAREQAAVAVTLATALESSEELAAAHQTSARVALILQDSESAIRAADAAQAADPAIPMRPFVEGRLLMQSGRYEEAAPVLQEAAVMLRQHGARLEGVEASLGEALARLDRVADAEAAFSNEIRMFPRHIDAYLGLARLYAANGQDLAAQSAVRGLLDAFPTPDAYSGAIRLWSELGQRSRADAIRSEARGRFRGDLSVALLGRDRR